MKSATAKKAKADLAAGRPSVKARHLAVESFSDRVAVTFTPHRQLTFGSERRAKEVCRLVLNLMRRFRFKASLHDGSVHAVLRLSGEKDRLSGLSAAVDRALAAFQRERLHPRVVEEILHITAQERLRWTKRGRLRQSGSGYFRNGRKLVHFALYGVEQIEKLSKSPETITAWRAEDAAGSPRI